MSPARQAGFSAALRAPRGTFAFTLIELIVVVIIIGILAAIGVAVYTSFVQNSKDQGAQTGLAEFAREASTKAILRGDGTFQLSDLQAAQAAIQALEPGILAAGKLKYENLVTGDVTGVSAAPNTISYYISSNGSDLSLALFARETSCAFVKIHYRGDPQATIRPIDLADPNKACNATPPGTASTDAFGAPVAPAPAAPSLTSATPGDAQVTLRWNAPSSTTNLTGYKVYRSSGAGSLAAVASIPAGQTSYLDPGLQNGTAYTYAVSSTGQNAESPKSGTLTATPAATTAGSSSSVSPPTGLAVAAISGSNSSERLSWSASPTPGVQYRIYVDGQVAGQVAALTYDATGLGVNQRHSFGVSAITTAAPVQESALAGPVYATPGASLTAPTSPSTVPGDGQIVLSWKPPLNGTPTGYNIRDAAAPGTILTTTTSTTFTVTGLSNGTSYAYTVEAYNAQVPQSDPASFPPTTPQGGVGAPRNLTATGGDGFVTLTWQAPNLGSSSLRGYHVFQTGKGEIALLPASQTSYNVAGLQNATSYSFSVTASTDTATSVPAGPVSATPSSSLGPPRNLSATPQDAQVVLDWLAPAVGAATGYRVYVDAATAPALTVTGTTATVTGLKNGQTYRFSVEAYNASATSPRTTQVSSTPQAPAGAPTALKATAGTRQVVLSWTAPVGPSTPTSYSVYAAQGTGAATFVASVPAPTTTYTVKNLTAFQSYTFYVTASSGSGESVPSPSVTVTPTAPPAAPVVVVHPGDKVAFIHVTSSTQEKVSSLQLFRDGTPVGSSPVSASADAYFTDSGLTDGTGYTWTAQAVNPYGTSPTSTGVATTPIGPPAPLAAVSATHPSASGFTVSWSEPAASAANPIESYNIRRCPVATDAPAKLFCVPTSIATQTFPSGTRSASDPQAPVGADVVYAGDTYNAGWTSFFAQGQHTGGAYSSALSQGAPDAVSDVFATSATAPLGASAITTLNWQYYAFPATSQLGGFHVYYCTTTGSPCGPAAGAPIATVGPGTTTYQDTTPRTGGSYAVASFNSDGESASVLAVAGTAGSTTPRPAPPGAPTATSPGTGSLSVSWQPPPSRTPNSPIVTRYDVYACSSSLTGTGGTLSECSAQTGLSPASASATFTGLPAGSYSVRVVATGGSPALPGLAAVTSATVS